LLYHTHSLITDTGNTTEINIISLEKKTISYDQHISTHLVTAFTAASSPNLADNPNNATLSLKWAFLQE